MRSIVQNNMEAVLLAPVNRPDLDAEYRRTQRPGYSPGVRHRPASGRERPRRGQQPAGGHAAFDIARTVATGGKRVAFLTGSRGVETIDIREESYREVLAQAGLTPEIHRVSEITLENAYRFVLG